MDNICHTLAGAALAECGFTRRLRGAALMMVVGANLPDVDVLAQLFGDHVTALQVRRGWTHGALAMVVLPLVLAGAVALWLRSRGSRNVPWRWLLAACAVAVVSHPWLDWLNTYGVRLLMPFSDRWFYGDTLFIVDLVMLVLLGGGWFVASRRRARGESRAERPARLAVSLVLLYIALMKVQSERSRDAVERALGMAGAGPHTLMIAPLPISVRTRSVLVAADSSYVERRVRAGLARVTLSDTSGVVITHAQHPLSVAAREREDWRRFAAWTRFPYFVPAPDGDSGVVFIGDARYASGSARTWAGLHVQLR